MNLLQVWQVKCPQCRRICNRNQKSCLYCGNILNPDIEQNKDGIARNTGNQEDEISSAGKRVTVNVDGIEYHSTDKYLPQDIRELMGRIDEEGYSKGLIDEWIKLWNVSSQRLKQVRIFELNRITPILWLRIGLVVLGWIGVIFI